MGTTSEGPEVVRGTIQRAGQTIRVVQERASETAYGRRGGSLYPIALVVVIAAMVVIAGASAPVEPIAIALVALALLAFWVGGSGR